MTLPHSYNHEPNGYYKARYGNHCMPVNDDAMMASSTCGVTVIYEREKLAGPLRQFGCTYLRLTEASSLDKENMRRYVDQHSNNFYVNVNNFN